MAPELTFADYAGDLYCGSLGEDAFMAALPKARARLTELTGADVPAEHARAWMGALCAMVDRVGGVDGEWGELTTVGIQRAVNAGVL